MSKKLKITEEQFNEFVDNDGSLVSGGENPTDGEVRTNVARDSKRPQTTDDYSDEAIGDGDWWLNYMGYSISENEEIDFDEIDDSPNSNITLIPDMSELSKSYGENRLQSDLSSVVYLVNNLGVNEENQNDVKSIVLKAVLQAINFTDLPQEYQDELKKMI